MPIISSSAVVIFFGRVAKSGRERERCEVWTVGANIYINFIENKQSPTP